MKNQLTRAESVKAAGQYFPALISSQTVNFRLRTNNPAGHADGAVKSVTTS